MTGPVITEARKDDISTVYAYYANPTEKYPNGQLIRARSWTEFNHDYKRDQEREFIKELHEKNPGVYSYYHIAYDNCN
jgi:hypothetical protein